MKYLQQAVYLNALDAALCKKDVEALHDVCEMVSRLVPHPVDQEWNSVTTNRARFANRLLVPRDDLHDQLVCEIPRAFDPSGELRAKANSGGLVHTEDNVVEYLRFSPGK